jgi:pyruvate/2-oxoacid:ferredoxin oxidoreductase alpha subunit
VVARRTSDVLIGNHALSYGAMLSRVQVIAAYPITPQTQVVEMLAEMCAEGTLAANFIKVESEHSALAACIGASATGARAFTATSSQGLALMHELLHWAAGSRTPIVMGNINRAMAPPWNIWTEQTDSLAQRDTGWMQLYCASNQEVLDSVIQAYWVAERVMLPCMIVLDAFVLSHTAENVDVPRPELVDAYLPPFRPSWRLDTADPRAFGGLTTPDGYFELRYKIAAAMEQALDCFAEADRLFLETFGRSHGIVESYRAEDAEILIIAAGAMASNARVAVDRLRAKGLPAGLLRIRVFRPFPVELVRRLAKNARRLCVIDRNISFGHGGIFAQEVRSALYATGRNGNGDAGGGTIPVFGFVVGLGGREGTIDDIAAMALEASEREPSGDLILWRGLKRAAHDTI